MEAFFQPISFISPDSFVTVQETSLTVRILADTALDPSQNIELRLLEVSPLKEATTGLPVIGTVTLSLSIDTKLPVPEIRASSVLGQSCGGSRDAIITGVYEQQISWTGLSWSVVDAPAGTKEELTQYMLQLNQQTTVWILAAASEVFLHAALGFSPNIKNGYHVPCDRVVHGVLCASRGWQPKCPSSNLTLHTRGWRGTTTLHSPCMTCWDHPSPQRYADRPARGRRVLLHSLGCTCLAARETVLSHPVRLIT